MDGTFTVGITDEKRNSLVEKKGVSQLDADPANRTAAFLDASGNSVLWGWSNLNGFYAVEEKPSPADGAPPDRNFERARRASSL